MALTLRVLLENRRAAVWPASAALGNTRNSMGTARKPIALRLPHHRAAAKTGQRDFMVMARDQM